MTEPQGGSDPKVFITRAELDGDEWVINGEKWFSSHAEIAAFLIVMAVTDPDEPPYERQSMFVVPRETPGVNIIRNVGLGYGRVGGGRRATSATRTCACPADHMLGPRGGAFVVAQTRLGGGRIHHAMRTVGLVQRSFDMMCERAVSRSTQGEMLGQQAARAGDDRRLVDGDRAVPPARAAHRVEDRQVQGLQARCAATSPRSRR